MTTAEKEIREALEAAKEFFRNGPTIPTVSPHDAFIAGYSAALAQEGEAEPAGPSLEEVESISTSAAISQWERSLKRPDLSERDRLIGAIEAYKRQSFACLLAVAHPAPADAGVVETWRHKKRGTTYHIVARGRLQVDGDLDNEKVVIYRGEDGQTWVRPEYEFNDGRFESVLALRTKGGE